MRRRPQPDASGRALPLFLAVALLGVSADIKAQLLGDYELPNLHPALAAARLGLQEDVGACLAVPTHVQVNVFIDRHHPLDEMQQTFGFDGYLRAWWTDPRLRFEPEHSCDTELTLTRQEAMGIWRPDLYWEEAVTVVLPELESGVGRGAGEMMTVSQAGEVFWSRQVRFTLRCPIKLSKLPFDTQRCNFLAGLYSQSADQVRLTWRDSSWRDSSTNGGLEAMIGWREACLAGFVATALESANIEKTYLSGNYTYVLATLDFTRSPDRFVFNYFLVSLVMVIISWRANLLTRSQLWLYWPSARQ